MEVTLKQIVDSQSSLGRLITVDLPNRTAFRLARVIKAIETEVANYSKVREELFKKLGKLEEDEKTYSILPENLEEFKKQHEELISEVVPLPEVKITMEDLGNAEVKTADILVLDWLITEE